MSLRDRVKRALEALGRGKRRQALQELRKGAEESAVSVLDDVVGRVAGHSVRTTPREVAPVDPAPASELHRDNLPPKATEPSPRPPQSGTSPPELSKGASSVASDVDALVRDGSRKPVAVPTSVPKTLVLLVRDPDWLFAYWPSVADQPTEGVLELIDEDGAHTPQDVDLSAGRAFVRAPVPGRRYRARLVAMSPVRTTLSFSSAVFVPNRRVSDVAETPQQVLVGPRLTVVPQPEASSSPLHASAPDYEIGALPSSWVLGALPSSA